MSDAIATCDGCGAKARRRRGHVCPDHWAYIETADHSSGETQVVWACSAACQLQLWKRGPGPATLDAAAEQFSDAKATLKVALTERVHAAIAASVTSYGLRAQAYKPVTALDEFIDHATGNAVQHVLFLLAERSTDA